MGGGGGTPWVWTPTIPPINPWSGGGGGGARRGGFGRGDLGGGGGLGRGTCPQGQALVNHRLPLPPFNHTINPNLTLTFVASGLAMAAMLIRLNKIFRILFMAAFCHIMALYFGPQH